MIRPDAYEHAMKLQHPLPAMLEDARYSDSVELEVNAEMPGIHVFNGSICPLGIILNTFTQTNGLNHRSILLIRCTIGNLRDCMKENAVSRRFFSSITLKRILQSKL
ncbi:MAG: hypothetical protein Tsb0015_03140 [Simkaniaceae bacterium]